MSISLNEKSNKKKGDYLEVLKITFLTLPNDCISIISQNLDMKSMCKFIGSCKKFKEIGLLNSEHIFHYLISMNQITSKTLLSQIGNDYGKVSYQEAIYKLFTKENHEVWLLGGLNEEGGFTNICKMIYEERDEFIKFENINSFTIPSCQLDAIYFQGEVYLFKWEKRPYSNIGLIDRINTLTLVNNPLHEDFPHKMTRASSVIYQNRLNVIGGINSKGGSSKARYELQNEGIEEKWFEHPETLNEKQFRAASIEYNRKIFFCGGWGEKNVEIFDPKIGTWALQQEKMKRNRCNFSLFIYEDELYAVGGEYHGGSIEKMNKETNIWEMVTILDENRDGNTSMLIGSKIFIFGGKEQKTDFNYFDLKKNKWASKDEESIYFNIENRFIPREIDFAKAVLITNQYKVKTWKNL